MHTIHTLEENIWKRSL